MALLYFWIQCVFSVWNKDDKMICKFVCCILSCGREDLWLLLVPLKETPGTSWKLLWSLSFYQQVQLHCSRVSALGLDLAFWSTLHLILSHKNELLCLYKKLVAHFPKVKLIDFMYSSRGQNQAFPLFLYLVYIREIWVGISMGLVKEVTPIPRA